MESNNLQPKCIRNFTSEDTIYMREKSRGSMDGVLYLCQFISFKNGVVKGSKIKSMINESSHAREAGDVMMASLYKCALYGKSPITDHTSYHWFKGSGFAIYEKDYLKHSDNSDIVEQHESFGMVGISRRQSRGTVLFGSSINHDNVIALTIKVGEVKRKLNREWYGGNQSLIEIEMSQSQFSECITTPNTGDGVPCTIRRVAGDIMLNPPYENRKDMFSNEFKNTMSNIAVDLVENEKILQGILSKKSIGKADKEEILRLFTGSSKKITDRVPFIQSSFTEQMDKSVTEAKGEIEAFINRRLTEAGKKALLGDGADSTKLLHE